MNKQRPTLILDANAFIGNSDDITNLRIDHDLIVTPSVIRELKDKTARKAFSLIRAFLKKKSPSEVGMKFVRKFAKKTGDLGRLSKADLEIIALGVDLVGERGKSKLLRKRPRKPKQKMGKKTNKVSKKQIVQNLEEKIEEEVNESEISESTELIKDSEILEEGQLMTAQKSLSDKDTTGQADTVKEKICNGWVKTMETNSESNDYSGGWLGPNNISKLNCKEGDDHLARLEEIGVGVVTKDFAMQNVILQIGLPLMALNGTVIRRIKSFILECFSCGKSEKNNAQRFCKSCGKDTLSRVTCEYSETGELILYRKKNYKPKKRGTRYNIPQPKGGRRIEDLFLNEDSFKQRKVVSYLRKQNHHKKKGLVDMEMDWDLNLEFDQKGNKRKRFGDLEVGYGGRNPNVNGFSKKRGKKK